MFLLTNMVGQFSNGLSLSNPLWNHKNTVTEGKAKMQFSCFHGKKLITLNLEASFPAAQCFFQRTHKIITGNELYFQLIILDWQFFSSTPYSIPVLQCRNGTFFSR